MPEGVASDLSAGQWLGWWLDRRLGPIHHEACATSNTDQPDSVPHVRDIVPWRDVGTIEATLTSRANRGGPAGESGADVFDLILFELLVHAKEVSRERFKLASCLQLAKGRQHPSRRTITLHWQPPREAWLHNPQHYSRDEGPPKQATAGVKVEKHIVAPWLAVCYRPRSNLDQTREACGERSD